MLAQERDERHEDARRAEAALQPVSLAERGLKRMQRVARAVSEALHGLDLVAVRLDGEHEAGADRLAVLQDGAGAARSEEHTSELQSRLHLVCRLLLEKKKAPPTSM